MAVAVRWRAVALAFGLLLGALALSGRSQTHAGTTIDWLVYQPPASPCMGGISHPPVTSIHEAVDGANLAGAPATIFVCAGNYPEPNLVITHPGISLLGPGTTPEDDGVATIQLTPTTGHMVEINAEFVSVDGFTFDGTPPPNYNFGTTAVLGSKGHATVSDDIFNVIANTAIAFYAQVAPDSVNILRNHIVNPGNVAIQCTCSNSVIEDNVIEHPGGNEAVGATGTGITFSGNTVLAGEVYAEGDSATISDNTFDGQGTQHAYNVVSGYGVTMSGNVFKNIDSQSLIIGGSSVASVTLTNNTFQDSQAGIQINDNDPTDQNFVNVHIGGSPADANVFSGIAGDLVFLTRVPSDIPAEYNNWGYCSAAEIEAHITHHPDDPTLGTVDYVPFIDPGNCFTPTPTPSTTASPTPTPTDGGLLQGDLDCSFTVNARDALDAVRYIVGLALSPGTPGCVDVGSPVAGRPFGDVNCDGAVDARDAITLLQQAAGLHLDPPQPGGCTPLGQTLPS